MQADQPEEYDALWMLERKARSIGQESQESLQPFSSESYSPSKVHETSVPNDYVTQGHVYSGNAYAPMIRTSYVCTDCGKKYKWMDSLKRHQRVDCERKYSPSAAIEWYYQYQTMYLRLMAENQLTKEPTKETAVIETNVCPDNYAVTEKIQNSQPLTEVNSNQVTAGHRDYSCPRCGNAYTRPHSLNRHMRFECGVEPQFECPICHKKSKHKHNLVLHMRTHQKP
ncbi:zinc finger protein 628-like [Nylanderia fulva]|uniref:zinc finger protein 628-like n=1 Tax=Nylanderia fulva TaxID=613905 RepID=UPI0010FB3899|nr:zinc finger protein 628-like [Nylanderia fulva]